MIGLSSETSDANVVMIGHIVLPKSSLAVFHAFSGAFGFKSS